MQNKLLLKQSKTTLFFDLAHTNFSSDVADRAKTKISDNKG